MSAVCGPYLHISTAEGVDQTSAVCNKKTEQQHSKVTNITPNASPPPPPLTSPSFHHRKTHRHHNAATTTTTVIATATSAPFHPHRHPPPPPPPSPSRRTTAHHPPRPPPLLSFKQSADVSGELSSWAHNATTPCRRSSAFYGVSCLRNRVTGLVLEGLSLQGRVDSLTGLVKLRLLSLKHNNLTGTIPNLSNLTSLKLLFLSHNQFSGEIPPELPSLFRLDLSFNLISGEVPATLNRLTHLLTLRLEQNQLTGSIDFVNLPNLQDFNISMNNISGEIPASLSRFPQSVFLNNSVLCGLPMVECTSPEIPSKPSSVVSSSPTSLPSTAEIPTKKRGNNHNHKISTLAIVAIIIGDVMVLALVSVLLYCYFAGESLTGKNESIKSEKSVKSVYPSSTTSSFDKGRMVFFEGVKRFELEELLRASAEMLGKGGLGTAYKAVLDDGGVVAVKRLKEVGGGGGKREFEQVMEVVGRLRHPNVVSLMGYYYAKDEKLLVCEYMSNGNLFWLLHGNRGPGRTPLDWPTRLKIAAGAASGLAFIHTHKLTHGNIKSTNILLDASHTARVSDVGHTAITPPTTGPRSSAYRAPELSSSTARKPSHKSDVYSFGVLLMEILTGKCPSTADNSGGVDLPRWVRSVVREEWTAELFDLELMRYKDIEEEMVALLNIALSCTVGAPDQRPTMEKVVRMIDEVSRSRDVDDSAADSAADLA